MIHDEHPFQDRPEQRDPVRRLRGRLAAPVTIVTAGGPATRTGLTVSSLSVIEGAPGVVQLVVGPTSDMWDVAATTGRFVVHVCRGSDRPIAEVFAGLRPSLGGLFSGLDVTDGDHGPIIDALTERAHCQYVDRTEIGYAGVITATITAIDTGDLDDPLIYFRGGYRSLD